MALLLIDVVNPMDFRGAELLLPAATRAAHNIARLLTAAGSAKDARALSTTLGDPAFGQAGKLYRQMTAPPADGLQALADPTKLREALKTLELRGELSQQITTEHMATLAAYEARKKLTGEALPEGLKKQMQAIEGLWSRGEEAVTLDGTRLGRIGTPRAETTYEELLDAMIAQGGELAVLAAYHAGEIGLRRSAREAPAADRSKTALARELSAEEAARRAAESRA